MTYSTLALLAIGIASLCSAWGRAGEIVYPPNAGVFNVVTDGGVDNTGKTDVTEKLQQILYDGTNATGRRLQVLYFPKGTYLVSGQLRMKLDISRSPASHSHGPWIVGQSRSETIIRLKDGTWTQPAYDLEKGDEKGRPHKRLFEQCVLSTGDSTNTTFNKIIRNLTINTGSNNAGAIGLMYNTSNTGYLGEVDILSEDGSGHIALALAGVENGPGQVRGVRTRGFDVGVYNVTDYVTACSDLLIERPNRLGWFNHGQTAGEDISIDMGQASGPAVHNDKSGVWNVVGLKISGQAPDAPAIRNEGMLWLRDVQTTGFVAAVRNSGEMPSAPAGAAIDEYFTGEAVGLFSDTRKSLRLPIRKQPFVPYETDFSKWANPLDFGAVGDGKADDTAAVQKALNEPGKTHVVFPYGKRFRIKGPLTVGPEVVRLVGTTGVMLHSVDDNASLTIGDGNAPVFVMEGFTNSAPIYIKTDRTVVLDSVRSQNERPEMPKAPPGQHKILPPARYFTVGMFFQGGGEVFVNNTGTTLVVDNPKQRLWFRHYNSELGQGADGLIPIDVKAGTVWLLGWKSENLVQRVRVHKEGVMELIGFNNYEFSATRRKDGDWPIFEIIDGTFSCNGLVQRGSQFNKNLVWETRNGETRKLTTESNPGIKNFPLYTSGGREQR
jgi:hypothetical protein